MRYTLLYIYTLAMLALVSCKDDASSIIETEQESGLVLSGINATIIGGDGLSSSQTTRAENGEDEIGLSDRLSYSNDYIGRKDFRENEKIVLTTFKRSQYTLPKYSYENILYNSVGSAWSREESISGYDTHDRIYWSDNASDHTCIGFCTPLDWVIETKDTNGKTTNVTFNDNKWNKNSGGEYEGAFTLTEETLENNGTRQVVDFTAIEDDLKPISSSNTNLIDRTGTKLQNEDLLLYHKLDQQADIGGMTATLGFRHALASLRIVIDIREFSATEKDRNTKIYDLELLDQPYKYKWTQEQVVYQLYKKGETGLKTDAIGWGVVNNMRDSDSPVTIKTWQPRPNGEGTGEDKTYTFYSLIVPGVQTSLNMRYKVDYAEGTSTVQTSHTYQANLNIPSGIKFIPGYTTTVRVSLNHSGEPIYIGAEFIDWENVETPDQSELQKVSTFLDTNDFAKVTKAGETTATKEDATWLYIDQSNKVVDKNGNDGKTKEKAFVIKSARQFLSFAKEVNNGRDFKDLYVKLEADIFLQPNINEKTNNINNWTIVWPGIGTADKPFEGYFDGGNRIIKLLKGSPLFVNIGANAHIETLDLEDVIGDITGGGCLANVNKGILCGCQVLAKNNRTITLSTTSNSYAGFICGENQGTIIACDAQGDFKSTAHFTGGITGNNDGSIVASIAIGKISSSNTSAVYGGITASNKLTDIMYCCFDKTKNSIVELADKDIEQIIGLTTIEMQKEVVTTNLNNAIINWSNSKYSSDADKQAHFKSRNYTFHVGQYPRVH